MGRERRKRLVEVFSEGDISEKGREGREGAVEVVAEGE